MATNGENDELFDPEKVIDYAELPEEKIKAGSIIRIVINENHLSIIKIADTLIADTILKFTEKGL